MDKKMHKVTKVKFRKNIYILYPYFCEFLLLVVAIFKLRHSILFYIKWLTQTKSGKTQQHWDASSRLQLFLMLQIGWILVSGFLEIFNLYLHDFWLEKSTRKNVDHIKERSKTSLRFFLSLIVYNNIRHSTSWSLIVCLLLTVALGCAERWEHHWVRAEPLRFQFKFSFTLALSLTTNNIISWRKPTIFSRIFPSIFL